MQTLANIIEYIKRLSIDEIEEVYFITEKYIIDKRRNEFYLSHRESLKEYKEGKLHFSSDINRLKSILDTDD